MTKSNGKRFCTAFRISSAWCDALPGCGMMTKRSTSESSLAEPLAYEPKSTTFSGLNIAQVPAHRLQSLDTELCATMCSIGLLGQGRKGAMEVTSLEGRRRGGGGFGLPVVRLCPFQTSLKCMITLCAKKVSRIEFFLRLAGVALSLAIVRQDHRANRIIPRRGVEGQGLF